MADNNWNKGDYLEGEKSPDKGLSVARMAAVSYTHLTLPTNREV